MTKGKRNRGRACKICGKKHRKEDIGVTVTRVSTPHEGRPYACVGDCAEEVRRTMKRKKARGETSLGVYIQQEFVDHIDQSHDNRSLLFRDIFEWFFSTQDHDKIIDATGKRTVVINVPIELKERIQEYAGSKGMTVCEAVRTITTLWQISGEPNVQAT